MSEALQQGYDPKSVEAKWQRYWDEHGTNRVDPYAAKNPKYVLMMFPYPSAEGLHVGNVFAFTGADIQGRYWRLRGFDVFEPLGFDAFGIHSENYALKVGRHPSELIPSNIRNFTRQLRMMGFMIDWDRTVDTTSPDYYHWTQWIFTRLYKAGYVYRAERDVNWCPKCATVIADEQVIDGKCERHPETEVQRKNMPCWFFAITKLADRLDANLDWIDWSERTKLAQKNWIGRSEGAELNFQVEGRNKRIRVFTTRPDTIFGATYVVMAPDHHMVDEIADPAKLEQIAAYRAATAAKTREERIADQATKTGVDIGARALNPATGEPVPVFISDYVLSEYGTGAIMAVPSGDHRDFAFAKAFGLPVKGIIDPAVESGTIGDLSGFEKPATAFAKPEGRAAIRAAVLAGQACWSGPGKTINSTNGELSLDGLSVDDAKARAIEYFEKKKLGTLKVTYRLRDWCISRQRYWGPPIPMIYLEDGSVIPTPDEMLPVVLPAIEDFRPLGTGQSPLAADPNFLNVTLPDGRKGRRETDVSDNFLDSAWYFLRYLSSKDRHRAWDPALAEKWMPLDLYVGGNEHAVLHLLYTRFLCMALEDAGVLKMKTLPEMKDSAEPFRRFVAHGLLIRDGSKMSKSKGNVVNPDEYVEEHGADTLRLYLMFLGPFTAGGDFRDKDIMGIRRFLNRVHAWIAEPSQPEVPESELPKPVRVKLHQTIKKVAVDIESFSYNTAIAALMELHNELKAAPATSRSAKECFALMLAPFAPHFAEELWQTFLGHKGSVFSACYPDFDPALTVLDEVELAVQVNGKIRDRFTMPRDGSTEDAQARALALEEVKKAIDGKPIKRVVVVPGRLVNVIL